MADKADKHDAPSEDVDELGLAIHKHLSTVLVVVPTGYAETTLRYARSALFNVSVHTHTVAPQDEDLIRGELQDEFQADGRLDDADMGEFTGVLFCGGQGAPELAERPDVLELARAAASQDKLIGAWGLGVAVLARSGVARRKRVTGDPSLAEALRAGGARYTGTQVEVDGKLVTALDDAAGFRFGKALVQIVAIP